MNTQAQEVAKKQNTAVGAVNPVRKDDFGFETATANDIKVPMIYVAQAMSKIVDAGNAQNGDIVENLDNTVIAKKGIAARFIPFYFQKSYQIQKEINGKKEFHGVEPWDGEREYEEMRNVADDKGVLQPVRFFNVPSFNFFVFREGDTNFTRYLLPFRGSRSINKGGKILLSQLMNKMAGANAQPPYNYVAEVSIEQVENGKGKWYIMNAKLGRNASGQELTTDARVRAAAAQAAMEIKGFIASGAVINHGEDPIDTAETTPTNPSNKKDNF